DRLDRLGLGELPGGNPFGQELRVLRPDVPLGGLDLRPVRLHVPPGVRDARQPRLRVLHPAGLPPAPPPARRAGLRPAPALRELVSLGLVLRAGDTLPPTPPIPDLFCTELFLLFLKRRKSSCSCSSRVRGRTRTILYMRRGQIAPDAARFSRGVTRVVARHP